MPRHYKKSSNCYGLRHNWNRCDCNWSFHRSSTAWSRKHFNCHGNSPRVRQFRHFKNLVLVCYMMETLIRHLNRFKILPFSGTRCDGYPPLILFLSSWNIFIHRQVMRWTGFFESMMECCYLSLQLFSDDSWTSRNYKNEN